MVAVPPPPELVQELEVLLRANHPLLLCETVEEDRVETVLGYVADRAGLPLFVWNANLGLQMRGPDPGRPANTADPEGCLAFIEKSNLEAIFYLPGFPPIESAGAIARLKSIYRQYFQHRGLVVMAGAAIDLPADVEPLFSAFDLPAPSSETYHRYVSDLLREVSARRPIQVDLSSEDVTELLGALHGLTFFEVRKIITRAVIEDGRLDRQDLTTVLDAKRRIIERSGLLQYFPHERRMNDIAGLASLKAWLQRRRLAFAEPARAKAFGLTPPKGLLLLGVQGCGKSLCAKAVAAEWRLPLIRFDPGNLFQKYFGESERNLRRALRMAEDMAPCVLWVDEIEKGLGQGDNDGGTSQRVFGTFLAWLQEKQESVFVIATANDISNLPPELLRKGRFDEIFFVDLPSPETRARIFEVHLRRRQRDPAAFDLEALGQAADGFSGAEIETAVMSALYSAFAEDRDIDTASVLAEIEATRPLSVTMAEKLQALRSWALDRAVPAE